MRKLNLIFIICFISAAVSAQNITAEQYIEMYKDIAISEMKRVGVPASITLAQGLLETESGNSELLRKSNNHFGIKCKSSWTGSSVTHDDDEEGECFRKYNTAEDSYRDHSNFLRGSERYAALFKLKPTDYKGWAYGLKKAGYATNPAYPKILIKSIEDYNLQQYTLMGLDEHYVADTPGVVNGEADTLSVTDNTIATDDNSLTGNSVITPGVKTKYNGLRAIYVLKGTSLLAIATENDIALARLLDFNDRKEDGLLEEDAWIFLERKSNRPHRDVYINERDQSVWSIAQINAIQLSALLAYNSDLKDNDIVEKGRKINLQPPGQQSERPGKTDRKTHVVQAKEGLYSIARKYNVTVQELREWNQLSTDDLRIGQKLIISK